MSYHDATHFDALNDRAEHNLEHGDNVSLPDFLRLLLTNRVPAPFPLSATQPGGNHADDISSRVVARPAHLRLVKE